MSQIMISKIRSDLIGILSGVIQELDAINVSETVSDTITRYLDDLESAELLIPVVGPFSAGKTTLLNNFMNRNGFLPVGVSPETSLATEIRYGEQETVEAIRSDGSTDIYTVNDFELIKLHASDYAYLRVYCNAEALKSIEPLVLVDMPGFDSPLDVHNRAILFYLSRGVHYMVLSSADTGVLSRTLLNRIAEIEAVGRTFSLFLSKANLRPSEDILQLKEYIADVVDNQFAKRISVTAIGDDANGLRTAISSIDPGRLFVSVHQPEANRLVNGAIESINFRIAGIKNDVAAAQKAIDDMDQAIADLQNRAESEANDIRDRHGDQSAHKVIREVLKDIQVSTVEFVSLLSVGNKTGFEGALSDSIRTSLTTHLNQEFRDIRDELLRDFQNSLQDLNSTLQGLDPESHFLETISKQIQDNMDSLSRIGTTIQDELGQIVTQRKEGKEDSTRTYRLVTSLLAITTSVVNPVVEVLIVLLPDLINILFKAYQEKRAKELIENAWATQVFPAIARGMNREIPKLMQARVEEMVTAVMEQYARRIEERKNELASGLSEKKQSTVENEARIEQLKESRRRIELLAERLHNMKEKIGGPPV